MTTPNDPSTPPGDSASTAALHFGTLELRLRTRQLLDRGVELPIGGRAFDLLQVLALRHHQIVSADELLRAVWPGQVVEPNNLQVQVWALRKLLGPKSIATVARRGYRFVPELAGRHRPAAAGDDGPPGAPLQRLLSALRQHRLVTLTSDNTAAALRLALACAHRTVIPLGGVVWQLDGPELVHAPDDAAARPARDHPLRHAASRPDALVLRQAGAAPAALAAPIQQALSNAPLLRVLLLAPAGLGLPQEQVLALPVAAERARPPGSALRWRQRERG